jgi:hypothetical protein
VIVLDVLHRLGYGGHRDDLQRVGGTGDGGIDGVISLDKLGWKKYMFRKGKNTVGSAEIRGFYGALHEQKAKRGVFITTSGFSAHARDYARKVEGLVLVDGERLVHLMIEMTLVYHRSCLKYPNWIWIILSKAINFDRMIIDLVTRDGNAGVNDDNTTADSPGMLPYFRLSRGGHSRGVVYLQNPYGGVCLGCRAAGKQPLYLR